MAVKHLLLLFLIVATVAAVKKSYEGYKVYKVVPNNENDVDILVDLQKSGVGEFWEEHFFINHDVKVMVSSGNQTEFVNDMKHAGIEAVEVIPNLQKVIDDQLKPHPSNARTSEALLSMTWDRYHTLDEINNWLDELASTYPNIVSTEILGVSYENRNIKGIIINYRPDRSNPLIGMLEGTLHAREWISPATVTWVIKEFLTSTDPEVRALAENFEWHIFPVVNPDGYVYTFTDHRMWRKNRNPSYSVPCAGSVDDDMSNGVDLNRNFGHLWMTIGASSDPCSNTFAGPSAFSEPESLAIAQYVRNLNQRGDFIYYLAFHSYTQLIVIPYSHVEANANVLLANNYADTFEIAIKGADKVQTRFGTQYRAGVSSAIMYPMSGTSFDWVKYEADVPVTYLFELRDLGEYGFLLPAEQIIPNNLEFMDMLVEMDRTTRHIGYYSGATSILRSVGLLVFSIILIVFVNIKA